MQHFVATCSFSTDFALWAVCRLYHYKFIFIVSLTCWHIHRRLICVGGVGWANTIDARWMCFLERIGFLLHLSNHFQPSWSHRTGCSHHLGWHWKNSAGAAERLARPVLAGERTEPGISGWVVYPLGVTGSQNSQNWTRSNPVETNGKLSCRSFIKYSLLNKGNNIKLALKFTKISRNFHSNMEELERNAKKFWLLQTQCMLSWLCTLLSPQDC